MSSSRINMKEEERWIQTEHNQTPKTPSAKRSLATPAVQQGRRGQGHGEKLKNLLEYERDEVDEHDYGSGVDTDEEIDDLDDF